MLTRRALLHGAAIGATSVALRGDAAPPPLPRLIVVVMLDDLGKAIALDPERMPNWAAVRAEGREFTRAYSMALCVPSRATLLSGLYPCRTGWTGHWGHWQHETSPTLGTSYQLLVPGLRPWPRLLQDGPEPVRTVVAGKWHLGDAARGGRDAMLRLGWSRYCVWDGDLTGDPSKTRYRGEVVHSGDASGAASSAPVERYLPDLMFEVVADEVGAAAANPTRTTVIYYPMLLPHRPLVPPPGAPEGLGERATFLAMCGYADHLIGRLVATIRDHGMTGQTLLMVTTDNGTAGAGKGELSERGVCVPFTAWGPTWVPPGSTSDTLIDFTDFLPTLCALTDRPAPGGIDGFSFASALFGTGRSARGTAISMGRKTLQVGEDDGLLRTGDWPRTARVAMRGRYKLLEDGLLWNLEEDAPAAYGKGARTAMLDALNQLPAADARLPLDPAA